MMPLRMTITVWGWLRDRLLAWHRSGGASPEQPDSAFDEFDRRMRLSSILAFFGGSLIHLLVALFAPEAVYGGPNFAFAMVILGVTSGLGVALLPWRRYGRDLFAIVLLYAALLIAGLVYSTGGATSPFGLVFLLITISTGLYKSTRLTVLIAGACATLGFLPLLYSTPGAHFILQQAALSACVLASAAFHRLIVPELLRRTRTEQVLQDDLRETRLLRDELAQANALLAQQARTDPLTGLANHGAIIAEIDAAFAQQTRSGTAFALIFFDIDRFKQINDTYGHRAGDMVLTQVAHIVAVSSGLNERPGRYGGEEFLSVLGGASLPMALHRAERLRAAVARHPLILPNGAGIAVTISIGVAAAPAHSTQAEALLNAADDALYRAKDTGRNRVCAASSDAEDLGLALRAIEQHERERAAPR